MKAILFVGHGSRDSEGNDEVRHFIESMRSKWDDTLMVQTCFLEFEGPTVNQGIDNCVEKRGRSYCGGPDYASASRTFQNSYSSSY